LRISAAGRSTSRPRTRSSKAYDGRFKDLLQEAFDKEFAAEFKRAA
jgi:hypothetical protein